VPKSTSRRPAGRRGLVRRRRRPRGLLAVVWGVIALVFTIVGLALQVGLMFVAAVFAALAGVMSAFADFGPDGPHGPRGPGPGPATGRSPQPRGSAARPPAGRSSVPAGSAVRCTATRKPIDRCGCARRHVATPDGARRYGQPVGSPLGKARKP
jgi:hypothetical protein